MNFDEILISVLVDEIILEQHISPNIPKKEINNYVKNAIFSINSSVGEMINYNEDLDARRLLKNYCLYARYNKLAEFNQIYESEYVKLQFRYNRDSNV